MAGPYRASYYSLIGNRKLRYIFGHQAECVMTVRRSGRSPSAVRSAPLSLYLLGLALVIGCEPPPGDHPGSAKLKAGVPIIVVGSHPDDPHWPAIRGGALRYAQAVPTVRVECVTPPRDTPQALRDELVRVLQRQPVAVCLHVTAQDVAEPTALRANLDRIARAATLLITVGVQFNDPRIFAHVGANLPESAELLADNLPRLLTPRRTCVVVHRASAGPSTANLYNRFRSAVRRQPGVVILQEADVGGGDQAAAIEELLTLYPHAALVVTLDPSVWLEPRPDWEYRLRRANPGFRFATLSAAPPLWGRLGTPAAPGSAAALVGPLDGELGYAAVELAVRAVSGSQSVSRECWIPCEVVTPTNLLDFARRYSAAAGGLDVSRYLKGTLPVTTAPEGG